VKENEKKVCNTCTALKVTIYKKRIDLNTSRPHERMEERIIQLGAVTSDVQHHFSVRLRGVLSGKHGIMSKNYVFYKIL
jgi:hypothetical protein